MKEESMNSKERVWSAISLEKPDRVPIAMLATAAPVSRFTGITTTEFYANVDSGYNAIQKMFDEIGGWDLDMGSIGASSLFEAKIGITMAMGLKLLFPGLDLPDDYCYQAVEEEAIKPEDYDTIIDKGWNKFMNEDYIFRILDVTKKDLSNMMKGMIPTLFKAVDTWKKLGVESMYPTHNFPLHPFFRLSLGRSMIKFMEDLYYDPGGVERAMQVMTDELITDTIKGSKLFNVKIAMIVEERASTTFFPPKIFERFWWPYTKQLVEALHAEGIVTWFHLDTSWDENFHYFKELPRGSAVLALDGTSDIFLAKKILGGHLCLAGDVQAVKLSIGTPKQVEDYCKKLIDVVGKDGGFILTSGCEIPEAVNPENLKAMIKTGREYELSKK